MPFPDAAGFFSPEDQVRAQLSQEVPAYLQPYVGNYDRSKYTWDAVNKRLVANDGSGSYDYSSIPDPSLGTDVITNYGNAAQNTLHYDAGQTPYFGFGDSAQGYNGGDAPNSGMFISADPNAIGDYQSHRQDVVNQGIAKVGALVGGAALGGALGGNATTPGYGNATTTSTLANAGYGAAPDLAAEIAAGMGPQALGGGAALGGAGAAGFGAKLGNFLSKYGDYVIPGANALLGAYAADRATDAEVAGMDRAIAETARQYDTTRNDLMPWLTAGQNALGQLSNPGANFAASPDYEFRRSEGQRDIGNSFAARGMGQSGNALRALTEYNSNLASNEFGNWWNRQAGLAGVGQTTGTQLGAFGANAANNTGNYLANQGASRASGVLGKYGSIAGGLNDAYYNRLYRRAS